MGDPEQLFSLVEELGVGTYGRVYSAKPAQPEKFGGEELVAMKIISFSEDIQLLKHEVDIMKDCKSNFIVRFFDSYENEGAQVSHNCRTGFACYLSCLGLYHVVTDFLLLFG
jgi:serine/threonine protein kinase